MSLEDLTGTSKYIDDLVITNPAGSDEKQQGDDHIRGIKNVLKNTFPNITGIVSVSQTILNYLTNLTGNISSFAAGLLTDTTPAAMLTTLEITSYAQTILDDTTAAAARATLGVPTLSEIYPVGSIYINAAVTTNPATLLGFGTWTAFGSGRVPVGYNSGDTDFNTLEKVGGFKTQDLSHTHTVPRDGWGSTTTSNTGRLQTGDDEGWQNQATQNNTTGSSGSTVQSIVQPYIVVYMWKRTT